MRVFYPSFRLEPFVFTQGKLRGMEKSLMNVSGMREGSLGSARDDTLNYI